MRCLVKIYDAEQINNLVPVLAFEPHKVVFLHGKNQCPDDLMLLERTCAHKIDNINFEFIATQSENLDSIQFLCKKIIQENPECVFDITGGEELVAIGMYLACRSTFTPIFKIDIDSGKLINVYGCNCLAEKFSMPRLNLKTILMSKGALIEENLHPTPHNSQFDSILLFCEKVFENIDVWKALCTYIQNGVKNSGFSHKSLEFEYKHTHNGSAADIDFFEGMTYLLKYAQTIKLINALNIFDDRITFSFANQHVKKYMTDFGSWLELYTYITLLKSGLFEDLRMSVRIGWGGAKKNGHSDVINEVDITFFSGIIPVFVSCKLSCPNSEAIQELSIYSNYFGGKRSKCILVTVADVYTENPRIFHRAKEMGICIVDNNYIKSGNLIGGVRKAINNEIIKGPGVK